MTKRVKNQLDSLNAELALMFRDLKRYSDSDLNWKPAEGKWSVLQIMEHLILAESLTKKYVEKKLSGGDDVVLKGAGLGSALRSGALTMVMKMPFKVKAPDLVATEVLAEESTFWELVKQWNKNREELETYLSSLPPDLYKKQVYKHPAIGRMSLASMINFYKNHFRRHRKQIDGILRNFKY